MDWVESFKLLLGAGAAGAVVTAVMSVLGWRRNEETQRRIEGLKTTLTDALAQRTRRAEYVRAQLQNLYGPLGFLVESSARCIDTNNAIMGAYDKIFSRLGHSQATRREAGETIERANEFVALVVENNQDAIKVLRSGWGWLDADDVADAGQYLTDVHRHNVEFRTEGKMLPIEFYAADDIPGIPGKPSFIRPVFIERVRRKLREKQEELAGLTGTGGQTVAMAGTVQAAALPRHG
jgi:hypothetical protein